MEFMAWFTHKYVMHGFLWNLHFDHHKPILTFGDTIHLTNVIYNIIDNGLKYGGSPPIITISIQYDQNSINVMVTDNGSGIPKEYADKIFERFYRIPSNDQHNVKGYGLGLNYVQNIMDKHEGRVSVLDGDNGGALFKLTFKAIHEI